MLKDNERLRITVGDNIVTFTHEYLVDLGDHKEPVWMGTAHCLAYPQLWAEKVIEVVSNLERITEKKRLEINTRYRHSHGWKT